MSETTQFYGFYDERREDDVPTKPTTPRETANQMMVNILNSNPVYVTVATTGVSDSDVVVGLSIYDSGNGEMWCSRFYQPLKSGTVAQRIHGIDHITRTEKIPDLSTGEMVEQSVPSLLEQWDEIRSRLENRIVVAWNARFTMSMLYYSIQCFSRLPQDVPISFQTMNNGIPSCLWFCSQLLVSHRLLDSNPMGVPFPMKFSEATHRSLNDMERSKSLLDVVYQDVPLERLNQRNRIQEILLKGEIFTDHSTI